MQLLLHVACHMQQLAVSLTMTLSAQSYKYSCDYLCVLEPAMPAVCKICAPADCIPLSQAMQAFHKSTWNTWTTSQSMALLR